MPLVACSVFIVLLSHRLLADELMPAFACGEGHPLIAVALNPVYQIALNPVFQVALNPVSRRPIR